MMFISTLNYHGASNSINSPLDILRFDEWTEKEEEEEGKKEMENKTIKDEVRLMNSY